MKIVDVLCAEIEPIAELLLKQGDGEMGGVGLGVDGVAAAHGVEIPDEARVATPGDGSGDVFDMVVAPEAVGVAEGGDAAFRGDTGAGQKEDAVGGGEGEGRHLR